MAKKKKKDKAKDKAGKADRSVKDPQLYGILRDEGLSKKKSTRIANTAAKRLKKAAKQASPAPVAEPVTERLQEPVAKKAPTKVAKKAPTKTAAPATGTATKRAPAKTAQKRTAAPAAPQKRAAAPAYDEWTRVDLLNRAREVDVKGRSGMNKAELIKALRNS